MLNAGYYTWLYGDEGTVYVTNTDESGAKSLIECPITGIEQESYDELDKATLVFFGDLYVGSEFTIEKLVERLGDYNYIYEGTNWNSYEWYLDGKSYHGGLEVRIFDGAVKFIGFTDKR